MSKNLFFAGSLAFVFAGCAASNGGGHVVGNSMMPPNTAQKMAGDTCGCGHKHKDGDHKNCKCASSEKKEASGSCTSCGTGTCACGH